MPARASASAIARPRRIALPVTNARGRVIGRRFLTVSIVFGVMMTLSCLRE